MIECYISSDVISLNLKRDILNWLWTENVIEREIKREIKKEKEKVQMKPPIFTLVYIHTASTYILKEQGREGVKKRQFWETVVYECPLTPCNVQLDGCRTHGCSTTQKI